MTPAFSVILVNWNTAELLLRAVESVFRDSRASGVPVEVVVVDNGSTDESVRRLRETFPAAKAIENGRNLGFARAVNRGLEAAVGKHVVLLNTDATLSPGCLSAFLEAFEAEADLGILGGRLEGPDGRPRNSFAPFPSLLTELFNKSLLARLAPGRYGRKWTGEETALLEVDSVIGACLAIRGDTLKAVGPLDERFFFFFEETDWCFQAKRLAWRAAIHPGARIVHGQGESSKPVLADTRIEFHRSRYRYFQKNFGNLKTLILFEGMLIKLTVETVGSVLVNALGLFSSEKRRSRLWVTWLLLAWHIRGCPRRWGLEGRFLGAHGE